MNLRSAKPEERGKSQISMEMLLTLEFQILVTMYTFTKIVPFDLLINETIIELSKRLITKHEVERCEFEDSAFQAKFDFNIDKLISLINEYPDFWHLKFDSEEDNEFSIIKTGNYFMLKSDNHKIRDFLLFHFKVKWAKTLDYRNHNT